VSSALDTLLDRRLLLVTGKGGTGKSTLAVAIARLAARQGLETVVVELGDEAALPPLLSSTPEGVPEGDGRDPVPIGDHLHTLRIHPLEALTEYLELQIPIRPMVHLVTRNPAFRRLLEAAPGWRDLITLGKLWHLESLRDGGRPRWDLIVVDAPATGHGLSFLSIPRVVVETVRMGPLRRHTDWVQDLLMDPARTLVLPVTLLEDLPVRETLELCARVRELGFTLGPVLVNAVEPEPDIPKIEEVLASLGRIPESDAPPGLPPDVLGACIDHAVRRASLQRIFLEELERVQSLPLVEVPAFPGGVWGPDAITRVADALERSIEGGAIA
jgi:anion-transporting  ArsA/GET3 family ATPase